MEVIRPPTHGDKLRALLSNSKLPISERSRVENILGKYEKWISQLRGNKTESDKLLESYVCALNEYKFSLEFDLIFCSDDDFLYRQKGQLKIDNTVLEEFLPYLFDTRLVPGLGRIKNLRCGPQSSFAGISFASPFLPLGAGGVYIKFKDQDFAVSKSHRMVIANEPADGGSFESSFSVSHLATEVKTNLDKTMFQEASATAAELKRAVPGSRYLLLCEFLDMTPITTKLTSIDEVIVLRKAKRLGSNLRAEFSNASGRMKARKAYEAFLLKYPLQLDCFRRFVWHLNECFPEQEEDKEDVVLGRGYF